MSHKRKCLYWAILVAGTLFVIDLLVGALMIGFDLEGRVAHGLRDAHHAVMEHPYKAYMLRPGQRMPLVTGGEIEVNENGHLVRLEDLDLSTRPKARDEKRILFMGGSTTYQGWGFYLADLLNRQAGRTQRHVAVVAGIGGYTSQENLIDLAICGTAYLPDLVVAYLPVNDFYWAANYKGFRRDYSHMRVPLRVGVPSTITKYRYPFLLRAAVHFYRNSRDLAYFTTRGPVPVEELVASGAVRYPEETYEALVDNVRSMRAICAERKIPFVLVTQKLFPTDNMWYILNDRATEEAIGKLVVDPRLNGVPIIRMGEIFPDKWAPSFVEIVSAGFPETTQMPEIFLKQMSYDSMHFTIGGVLLFAVLLQKELERVSVFGGDPLQ